MHFTIKLLFELNMPDTVQFRFILQNILREKKEVGLSFRYLEDENFIRCILKCVLKGFPLFQFNFDIYRALIDNMNLDDYWESQWRLAQAAQSAAKDTPQSKQLAQLMSTAVDWIHSGFNIDDFTWETDPTHTSLKQVKDELLQVRYELQQVRYELQQVRYELQQVRGEGRAQPHVIRGERPKSQKTTKSPVEPGPSPSASGRAFTAFGRALTAFGTSLHGLPMMPSNYKLVVQIIQSVSYQNTSAGGRASTAFVKARLRVALCILYLSGFNIPKLLSLTVSDLKHLQLFGQAKGNTLPFQSLLEKDHTQHLLAGLREELDILISDLPGAATAFRQFDSERPCSRRSFTRQLNQCLSQFKLSSKSWRAARSAPD